MTSVYVTSEYSTQVARIRNLLQLYRESFLSLNYVDGTGHLIDSAYDIWINLCLIISKTRPAFLVKWSDYMSPSIYQKIMRLLVHYRDNIIPQDLDYKLLFLTDHQGIIVTTYYSYYKRNFRDIYANYLFNGKLAQNFVDAKLSDDSDTCEKLLCMILGFPAGESGESIVKENLETKHPQYRYTIYAKIDGIDAKPIMTNIYRTLDSRKNLNELVPKIKDVIKLYDNDSIITTFDTQSTDNLYLKDTHILHRDISNISDKEKKRYDDFIDFSQHKDENWNTEFDRIFEQGYVYNR